MTIKDQFKAYLGGAAIGLLALLAFLAFALLVSCAPITPVVQPVAPIEPIPTQTSTEQIIIPAATPVSCAVVTATEALHLRAGSNEKSTVLGYLYNGDVLTVIHMSNDQWWSVTTNNGLEGWANAKYLRLTTCQQE